MKPVVQPCTAAFTTCDN